MSTVSEPSVRSHYDLYADAFVTWDSARRRHLREHDEASRGERGAPWFVLDKERESPLLDRAFKAWRGLSDQEQVRAEIEVDVAALALGVYVHYARGEYTVTGFIAHHETQRPMVKYISHAYGKENARPLRGWPSDADGWNDPVFRDGLWIPRFRLMKLSPFDTSGCARVDRR